MSKLKLTVRQIMNLGLWSKVCEYKGWNEWIYNEGRIEDNDLVEFDDEFKKEPEIKYVTFTEAMNASKNGKTVRYYDKEGYYNTVFNYDYPINENGIEVHSFKDLLEGKWEIGN